MRTYTANSEETSMIGFDQLAGSQTVDVDSDSPTSRLRECPDFGRLAEIYRWMEWSSFGPFLQWCRCAWLDRLTCCRHALVLGDGDGRFTARLLRGNLNLTIDAVDDSSTMLAALMRRAGPHASRINAHAADIRNWTPTTEVYDLIVSHFFLDCLDDEEVRELAGRIRSSAADHALWVISEFAVPPTRFGHIVAGPLVQALYWAFGCLTGLRVRKLPDYTSALSDCGFVLERRRTWLGGLLTSELWSIRG